MLVADCVPILAGDAAAGVIAAVHAGRRGAAGGIALRMLERMAALGAAPGGITVVLGPAICGACYEVPAAMRDEVADTLPGSASTTDRGTPGLDLRAGLAAQLRVAGVAQVVIDPRCTYTDAGLFSHRANAPTGRFAGSDLDAALIMKTPVARRRSECRSDGPRAAVCRAAIVFPAAIA